MSDPIERRYTAGTIEVRATGAAPIIGGYALKFNRLSQNLGGFVERVAPGAVTKTVRDGGDVLARYQHRDEMLLGRVSAGTLRLAVDDVGLDYAADVPDTDYGRNLVVLAERGDVRHSSFAFRTMDDDWSLTEQGFPMRTLLDVQLVDVAPVVSPAYLDTTSGMRSLASHLDRGADEIAEALRAGRLAELLTPPPTVVDLKTPDPQRSDPEHTEAGGPGDTHPPIAVRQRRIALELLRTTP